MDHVIDTSKSFVEGRGREFCRGCLGDELFSAVDLGDLPIANELLLYQNSHVEKFPLHLRICNQCGLGQVGDVTTPERIFRDYRYFSSVSTTFLAHASSFVHQCLDEKLVSPGDWVLEIASNDGYLLKNFIPFGISTLGIEPAENVAIVSQNLGIETISEFFSTRLATSIFQARGFPKLIIANNVMAHVPDLIDFVKALRILTGPETLISIENPSLSNVLIGMQFDSIYHEHYSYLTASSIKHITSSHGLHLYKVEELLIHGGSNRYWLREADSESLQDPTVATLIKFEIAHGLFDPAIWRDYDTKVKAILNDVLAWLKLAHKKGDRVFGYGAAAKASTLLNSIAIDPDLLIAVADASLEKQKRFIPSVGIPIIGPEELFKSNPTDILIFPWNIKSEIWEFLRANCKNEVRFWCAIPEMHQVESHE